MGEFYKHYNLSASHFSKLLKMDIKTLRKYENGERLKAEIVNKIELAKEIIVNNNIIFPRYHHFMDEIDDYMYKDKLKDIDGLFKILYCMEA
jgi:hypothetical protein